MPILLALAWLVGFVLRGAWLATWWLLRALWAVLWRLAALAAALLVVAFSRPLAGHLLALALSAGVVRHLGGMGGRGLSGQRTTRPTTGSLTPTPVVKLKPVSAQRVATASYAETQFYTRALDGPGLLSMLVGPAGVGKSEIVWGSLRAGYDGEDFCGLATTKPRKVLLLSEMGGETLAPALRRWGLYAEPAGRLDAVRLRLLPSKGAGGLLDVLYATDIYRPVVVDGELRLTEWAAVVEAVRGLVERGRYDKVIIDSLGEWMGGDNNDLMLKTLGACRQLTAAGAGVLILHHTPRTDPTRPRGGTVIEAKLDTGFSVTGTAPGGAARSRQDPVRQLEWFKTRFPDATPEQALTIERIWAGPESGQRPRYRRQGATEANPQRVADLHPGSAPSPTPTANEAKVLVALRNAGRAGATMKVLAEQAGIPRQRAHEAVVALVASGRATVGGYADTPGGGPKASVYLAVGAATPRAPQDDPHGRLRLVVAPEGDPGQNAPRPPVPAATEATGEDIA
ncbi:MAG TPA: AAA family ATPase [Chloroflexota bacterium]|nr:AAA family ATPase [Chloroflexota bacterium]